MKNAIGVLLIVCGIAISVAGLSNAEIRDGLFKINGVRSLVAQAYGQKVMNKLEYDDELEKAVDKYKCGQHHLTSQSFDIVGVPSHDQWNGWTTPELIDENIHGLSGFN